jgi:hypothetical protein
MQQQALCKAHLYTQSAERQLQHQLQLILLLQMLWVV